MGQLWGSDMANDDEAKNKAQAVLVALEGLRVSVEHNGEQTKHLAESIDMLARSHGDLIGRLMVEASEREHLVEGLKRTDNKTDHLGKKIDHLDERLDSLEQKQAVSSAVTRVKIAGVLAGTGAFGAGVLEGLKRLLGE